MLDEYKKCIEACYLCATACDNCAASCLDEENLEMMRECIKLAFRRSRDLLWQLNSIDTPIRGAAFPFRTQEGEDHESSNLQRSL